MSAHASDKPKFTFQKAERISSRKEIKELFDKGSSFYLYPFKVFYQQKTMEAEAPASVLITVPKKRFKRAVHRNRLKRQIREAYRLQKYHLLDHLEQGITLNIAYIYTSDKFLPYKTISEKLNKTLLRLKKELVKN